MVETLGHPINEPTNQNSIKVPKLVSQRIRNRYQKTLGTSVINGSTFRPFLQNNRKNHVLFPKSFIIIMLCLTNQNIQNCLSNTIQFSN